MTQKQLDKYQKLHTSDAIQKRLDESSKSHYLKDALLGSVDGCVTCFALICGIYGAGYSFSVAIVLGLASLFADGFSMAMSNYFSTKSELDKVKLLTKEEEREIQIYPEGEKEEIRQIYMQKGFSGEVLENIVETITSDKDVWIQTMLQEEHGLSLQYANPIISALVTMASFILIGIFPLLPLLVADSFSDVSFYVIVAFTAIAFIAIGLIKAIVIKENKIKSILEALAVGAVAAVMAYSVSYYLKHYLLVTGV